MDVTFRKKLTDNQRVKNRFNPFSSDRIFSGKILDVYESEASPALPLVRSLIFQTIPPGPQIDHRRLYASVLTRSTSGMLPGLSLTRAGTR
jgi:hypothetical protein